MPYSFSGVPHTFVVDFDCTTFCVYGVHIRFDDIALGNVSLVSIDIEPDAERRQINADVITIKISTIK